MKKLLVLSYVFGFALIFNFSGCKPGEGQKAQSSKKVPNIIFILTDDLGYGDLGVLFQNKRREMGKPALHTPHLDKLAENGMLLTRHYVPAPVCAPSRASLMLGVHQGHANIRNNQFDKALADNHTIASVLKEAGYATGIIGKWGLQGREGNSPESWKAYPTKRGFDHFFGYVRHRDGHNHYPAHKTPERPPVELYYDNKEISSQLKGCYTTDLFTAAAKKWITDQKYNNPNKPFFLYLAYDTPHAGLEIAASQYPEGGGLNGGVQLIREPGNYINTAEESINDYIHPDYDGKDWPLHQKRFASMVRRIDNGIGDIMHLLKDLDINEETLVVFTSDNGPHNESYGYGDYDPTFFESYGSLNGIKRDTWEGGIRVPTLVHWPGHIPAGSDDTPTGFYDWMPTFAELSGLPAPARVDGVSLLPILTGKSSQETSTVYIEYQHGGKTPDYADFNDLDQKKRRGEMQVIYLDGYKGIRTNIKSADDKFHIFDTRVDEGETNDLAGTNKYFEGLQERMQEHVLRIRRVDTAAIRPYDNKPVPALKLPQSPGAGIRYKAFNVVTPWTPDISSLQSNPISEGVSEGFDLNVIDEKDDMVIEYKGLIEVPQTGEYQFTIKTDRGALVKIHESTLIDADKGYIPGSTIGSKIKLKKGYHPVSVIYARGKEGSPFLQLKWSGPGFNHQDIKHEQLVHLEKININ
jgi:arylsulfatase A-like enzyme